uniref:Kelch like family member 28 n=1 Tax=Junco hyemalis TaxID=40217 RepID=A0A8C5J3Q5_JUNHY
AAGRCPAAWPAMDGSSPPFLLAKLTPLHSEQLLQGLNLLRQHQELCDVVLRAGEAKIHAHKAVLASISPYFKAMFTGNLSEKENAEVEFQCVDEAALQAIVEYAYTGTVFISQDTVESLLPAANLLQVCCAAMEQPVSVCHVLPHLCQEPLSSPPLLRAGLIEQVLARVVVPDQVVGLVEAREELDAEQGQAHAVQQLRQVLLALLHVVLDPGLQGVEHRLLRQHVQAVVGHDLVQLRVMEMYFPQNDSWIGLAPLSIPRYEFGVCVLEQKMYVVGGIATHVCQGISYRKHESSVECWDPDTNTWSSLERMFESRSTLGVAVLAGELYALGGYDGQSYLRSVEKYVPKGKEWQLVAPMSRTRSCFAAAVLDGMIYAIGGYGPAHMNSMERYDPSKNSWETVASMADKRINFGVGVMLGFIFVVGGHNGVSHLSSIERYDPHQNQWTVCRPMKEPRTGVGAAVIDNHLYVVGGHSGSSYLNTVQRYEPISDSWLDSAGMMYCRCNFGLTAL